MIKIKQLTNYKKMIKLNILTNNQLFVVALFFVIFISCADNSYKKYYYETGQLWIKEKLVNKTDSVFYTKIFDKRGFLEKEGYTNKEQMPFGVWKEYYSDGQLKWKGSIENGRIYIPDSILYNMKNQFAAIEIEGHPQKLKVGQEYKIRTYIDGVPFDAYSVMTNSELFRLYSNKIDPEKFPLMLIPMEKGKFDILILLPDSNGAVIVGKSICHQFTYEVE